MPHYTHFAKRSKEQKEENEAEGGWGKRQLVGLEREKRKKKSQIWALPTVVQNFKNPLSLLLRRTIQRFFPPYQERVVPSLDKRIQEKFQSLMHKNSPGAQEELFCWIVIESPLLHV